MSEIHYNLLKKHSKLLAKSVLKLQLNYEEKIRELSILRRLIEQISFSVDLREACNNTLDILFSEFHPENSSLFLFRSDSKTLNTFTVKCENESRGGLNKFKSALRTMKIGEGAAGWAGQNKQILFIPDVSRDKRYVHFENQVVKVQSLVCIPFLNNDNLEGVICLSHSRKKAFAENLFNLMNIFKYDIGSAIGNIRLLDTIRNTNEELQTSNELLHKTLLELYKTQQYIVYNEELSGIGILSAGIAHEFNNIFTTIVGNSELALLNNDNTEIKNHIKSILKSSSRASEIIKKLLTFSGKKKLKITKINLNKEIDSILDLIIPELDNAGIIVERAFKKIPDFEGDAYKISQAIMHLMSNARHAMERGGTLKISTDDRSGWIELTIEDTGKGIMPGILKNVFYPFMTTKGALGGGIQPGMGLGLSIVYGIIKAHSGNISISSKINCGTKVSVRLPVSTTEMEFEKQQNSNPGTDGDSRV